MSSQWPISDDINLAADELWNGLLQVSYVRTSLHCAVAKERQRRFAIAQSGR